jgi:hypothetical protein
LPFLKDADEIGKIFHKICGLVFSMEHGSRGRLDIIRHTKKVKRNIYWHYHQLHQNMIEHFLIIIFRWITKVSLILI